VCGWFLLWEAEYAQLGRHVASGSAFVTNFVLVNESGYFDNTSETKPMLHLWSLAVEEQFYIVWPLVLWCAWKRQFNLLTITVVISAISFYLNLSFVDSHSTEMFFWPVGRFWEILSGSVLAWLLIYKGDDLSKYKLGIDKYLVKVIYSKEVLADGATVSNMMSFIGAFLLMCGVTRVDESLAFPSGWALIPVLGCILIIMSGSQAWFNRVFLMNRIAIWFGLISYPLYLWHWPILSFLQIVDGEFPHRDARIAAVFLSILLAWLTYRFIEKPIRLRELSLKRTLAISLLMVLVGVTGFFLSLNGGVSNREFVVKNQQVNAEFVGPIWKYANNELCKRRFGIDGSEQWGWFFCIANSELPPNVILLGTSYANHLYPGFVVNERLKHHSTLSIGTCGVEWIDYDARLEQEKRNKAGNSPCWGKRAIQQFEHINKIIESQESLKYAILVLGELESIKGVHYNNLLKRIQFIEAEGIKVILFQPHLNPSKLYDIKSCYSRPLAAPSNDCAINKENLVNENRAFARLLVSLQRETSVLGFNPNTLFCEDEQVCSYILEGEMPAFRDKAAHFSLFASERLFDEHFVQWAENNLPAILY